MVERRPLDDVVTPVGEYTLELDFEEYIQGRPMALRGLMAIEADRFGRGPESYLDACERKLTYPERRE